MRRGRSGPGAARRVGLLVASLGLVLAACGADDPLGARARDGRPGLHLTGTLDGRQLAVGDGGPRLFVGNCQPAAGPSEDVCFISRELGGQLFVLLLRNPVVLETGASLDVADPGCTACDDVTDVAVVDVRVGEAPVQRAIGGSLTLAAAEPGAHYLGRVRLELPRGTLSGQFDVVPRPD